MLVVATAAWAMRPASQRTVRMTTQVDGTAGAGHRSAELLQIQD
jgi:hypothetical protein